MEAIFDSQVAEMKQVVRLVAQKRLGATLRDVKAAPVGVKNDIAKDDLAKENDKDGFDDEMEMEHGGLV